MKPSSVLLLTAAGLATAFPAQPIAARSEIQDAPVARSFFEHAVDVIFARDLVPLNANTASPPAADAAAGKKGAAATTTSAAAAAATTTSAAGANNAAAPPAATDSAAAPPPPAATDATAAPPPPPAATDAAAPPPPPAAGNGTASAGNGGKGKGQGQGKGKGQGQGKGKGNGKGGNNNNNNGLGDAISGALAQLGLDGVLNVGKINTLSGAQQIQLLSQIVTIQTLADLSMVSSKQVAGALNQGFKSSGLNVVING
ncbi:hypothetical protein ACHAPX_001855 [Trichoderma viride]